MSEYAHFHTSSHHQFPSCRHISRRLPLVAARENQAAVGQTLKKSTPSASAAPLYSSPGTGGDIYAQGRKQRHASRFLSSCLLRKHCILDSSQSMRQLRFGTDIHTVSYLPVTSFWQSLAGGIIFSLRINTN